MRVNRHMLIKIILNASLILFPPTSILFLCITSDYMDNLKKYLTVNAQFLLIYCVYFLILAAVLYYGVEMRENVSWIALFIGALEIVLLHFGFILKDICFPLYSCVWSQFPYIYFLLDVLLVIYGTLSLLKLKQRKN